MSDARGLETLGPILHRGVSWVFTIQMALIFPGAVLDVALLARHVPIRLAVAAGFAGAALAVWVALFATPFITLLAAVAQRISAAGPRVRWLWPAPIALLQLVAAWSLTPLTHAAHPRFHLVLLAACLAAVVAVPVLQRAQRMTLALLLVALLTALFLYLDFRLPYTLYRELHDLAALSITCTTLAMFGGVRFHFSQLPLRVGVRWIGAMIAGSLLVTTFVDRVAPGWRAAVWLYGRHAPAMARACRALVDLDGDGYSPVAWGRDCNDFDRSYNPLAHDQPGGTDHNCNGEAPPLHPSNAQRGLAAPFGDPDLPPGAVDLVVLVSIDSTRADVFGPTLAPHLSAFATHGVRFTRAYGGGSRTRLSLPLLQRGEDHAPTIAERLDALGVSTSVVFGLRDPDLDSSLRGFQTLARPERDMWTAEEMTDRGIADVRAHPERHFLWLHYMDLHAPYLLHEPHGGADPPDTARVIATGAHGTAEDRRRYERELGVVDGEVSRLLDALSADGRLARTLVILTADHGEGFGEHGVYYHGVSGFEQIIHVPAFVVGPGVPAGVYDGLVSHRDVPATVLGAFALGPRAPGVEDFGRSWLRLRAGLDQPLHDFVVVRSARYAYGEDAQLPMAAIIEGHRKLCESFDNGLVEMYDLAADPGETHDLAADGARGAEGLVRQLELYRDIDQFP